MGILSILVSRRKKTMNTAAFLGEYGFTDQERPYLEPARRELWDEVVDAATALIVLAAIAGLIYTFA